MRHLPFLKTLAKAKDAADPVWRDAAPGYLVLRFFDRWLEEGPVAMMADPILPALRARLRNAKASVPEVRRMLLQTLDALEHAVEHNPASAAEHLFEYAEYLRVNGSPQLALHTYSMIAEGLETLDLMYTTQFVTALIQQGLLSRLLGDHAISRATYQRAAAIARQYGNLEQACLAKIGLGNTLKALGNLPAAEELLTTVIAEAEPLGKSRAGALAYHTRGSILHVRGRHNDAMRDYYRAYESLTGIDREHILSDLAVCEADAGYREAARDTHRLLAYTAQFDIVRAASLVNLIELAVLDGDEAEFDRARLDLTAHEQRHHLSVESQAHAALYTAMGIERFAGFAAAHQAYRVAIAKARSAQIHQIEFEAERRLAELLDRQDGPRPTSAPLPTAVAPPSELHYITNSIAAAAASARATLSL